MKCASCGIEIKADWIEGCDYFAVYEDVNDLEPKEYLCNECESKGWSDEYADWGQV